MFFNNASSTLGHTPLIRLNKLSDELGIDLLVKAESRNPGGSIKDRAGYAMIDDAERQGLLREGMTIVEPTSGNTGIALAAIGREKGYQVEIYMPESMSIERRRIIAGFGAKLVLTPAAEGMAGAVKRAADAVKENSGTYYMPNQFANQANVAIHILTTGPEIEADTERVLNAVVAGVGTGGTITGLGTYFKKIRNLPVSIIAVEPAKSPVITQKLSGQRLKPSPHGIQGIGAGFIPSILDLSVIDHVIATQDEDAITMARHVMQEEGIFCGISGGAAVSAAVQAVKSGTLSVTASKRKKFTVVAILPDSGERYLSTGLYE
ncbi:MAG: cysteine synthase A [Deferribacteraceae bacterium]|jgi:cysteine synthase A|nr:cysteine synthase A [Deferribacteraceae bacterium]